MKLFHRKFGDGKGKKILILHGLFGSSDNWTTFARMLGNKGYDVTLADLRNHGRSPHAIDMNYGLMAEDVSELIEDININGCILAGHSMGGKTAMKCAFNNPHLISKLIVIDIAPRYYPLHHQQILETLNAVDFEKIKTRGEADDFVAKGIPDESTRQFLLKNLYWEEDHSLNWRFNLKSITTNIETVGEAIYPKSKFDVPTLFIRGEKSDYITYDDERDIFDHFENVEVATIKDAGHWIHAEKPQELVESVIKFSES